MPASLSRPGGADLSAPARCEGYNHSSHAIGPGVELVEVIDVESIDGPVGMRRFLKLCAYCLMDWCVDHPRTCMGCGCTDERACPGGYSWAAPNVCSACLPSMKAI